MLLMPPSLSQPSTMELAWEDGVRRTRQPCTLRSQALEVTCLGRSFGTHFVTSYMQNYAESGKFELQITAYSDSTTVTVSVPCEGCPQQENFERRLTVDKGKMVQVELPKFVEIIGSKVFSSVVRIQSDKDVSVISLSSKPYSTETALLYPVSSLGTEHYVVGPAIAPAGYLQEFAVLTTQGPNVVDITLKSQVNFNGKTYSAGSKLSVTLNAFTGVQLQGKGDLSGTRIVSQLPVAVLSGHVCSWRYTKCNHVFEQLLPVSNWGKTFVAPPIPWQTKTDTLYVSASQATSVNYQMGTSKQTIKLGGGEVKQIQISPKTPIYLSADVPVQLFLYSNGASTRSFSYDTFFIGIPYIESYSLSYSVIGQVSFQNSILLVVKSLETGGLTVNEKLLSGVTWSPVPGSEYSWGRYDLPNALVPYIVANPKSPFCLISVGIASMNGYGSPGAGRDPEPELTCSNVLCRRGMVCKMINGQPNCVPSSNATCWAMGDPHYKTFDGRKYDFQGTCTYTFVKTRAETFGLPSFHIFAKNENRGNKAVSYVSVVTTEVYGYTITMTRSKNCFVEVNGIRAHLPIYLKDGNLQVLQVGTSVMISTDFQMQVSYDCNHHLRVTISSAYQEAVGGLCGNYNENPSDDFETPAGTTAPSVPAFGESWVVTTDGSLCWHDCNGPCKACESDQAKKYESEAYCGLLTKVSNGPFASCHAKVPPTIYFTDCVFDVCSTKGNKQSLCDILAAYANACQNEGAQIGDWRRDSGCYLECPPNSQYQICGTACPATCMDDQAQGPKLCPAVCVEGCQCLAGFVQSQGSCIPKSSCGCVYEGRPYAPNEAFWADDMCRKRCVCNPARRVVECADSACKPTERCQVVKGVRGCYPTGNSTCSASGDPHYWTFDKKRFDFQGPCAYVLAEVFNRPQELEGFSVYVQNEHRGNAAVTWTRSIQVNIYDVEIIVSRQHPGKVLVDGLLTFLPYSAAGGRIKLYRKAQDAVIDTDIGLVVTCNWNGEVSVTVPNTYANTLRGLCGNFNGNPADDGLVPGSILTPDRPVFGGSGFESIDPKCKEIADPKCPGMEELAAQQRAAGQECGLILAKDGPFRECHGQVDEEGAFQDCIYDFCFTKGRYAFLCAAIASYATNCQAVGVTIYPWRSATFCPPPCPLNSHYEHCAKACDQTCSSLHVPPQCPEKCEEDCVCNEGFVRSADTCVPMSECGCFYKGRYYPALEYFYPTCEERCRCEAGGNVVCHTAPCTPNEECKTVEGYRKCYPVGNATCSVVGDLYLSFDGGIINFQGTCTYFLTKLQKPNESLKPLAVIVKNEPWGNGKITLPTMVSVEVLGVQLTLLRNKWGVVLVDGVSQHLPVNLFSGHLRIFQHGVSITIVSTFGFALTYDQFSHVRLTIPSIYQDYVGGLCGNYNGDKSDDLQLPDGTVVTDVNKFAAAWKIPVVGVSCTDGCVAEGCAVCEEEKKEAFKQPSSCGLLTASNGPFSACHAIVKPEPYLDNCINDLCVGGGDQQILCHSLQSYMKACQEARVPIEPWRSATFCPLTCPANSYYTTCSNICETNCAGLTDHIRCPEYCVEGCQCDAGFFFDGLKCISLEECGCFERGRYFPPNEPVVFNDCKEKCICTAAGGFSCEAITCQGEETCEVIDGVMQCYNKDVPRPSCATVKCRRGMECQMMNGQPQCVPSSNATCWAMGDPHYNTFDGRKYDFQGTCTYTFVKTRAEIFGLPSFHIFAKNENRGNKAVSYVSVVTTEVYGYTITMTRSKNCFVEVNGIRAHLPIYLKDGNLQVLQVGTSVMISTDFQMQVSYDCNHHLRVTISSAYQEAVGGLCGNYNENPSDDFETPAGTTAPSVPAFGESWVVTTDGSLCWHDCNGPCKACESDQAKKYESEAYCGLLTKVSNGPFASCHAKVPPTIYFTDCVFDVCSTKGNKQSLCDILAAYANACQNEGAQIGDWRRDSGCCEYAKRGKEGDEGGLVSDGGLKDLECPPNSQYQICGTACPATCMDDQAQGPKLCPAVCVEGCQCLEGFVQSQGSCIPKSSCGCVYEGHPYAPNEAFWADDMCRKRCVCNPARRVVECSDSACKPIERCQVVKGVRGCYPTGNSTCSASGDPHYWTFDKKRFDFQGPCAYVLAEVFNRPQELEGFSVYVQNEHRGNAAVTWTRSIQVNIYDVEIIVSRQHPGKVLVDGLLTFLPYSAAGGRIKLYRKAQDAVIDTDIGLVVTCNWNGEVSVTVPNTYANTLRGLCGNFNGNPADDGLVPGSILTPDRPVFGGSGFESIDPKCKEIADPKCPGMEELAAQQRAAGQECGLILAKDGPFRECHGQVDEEGAFQDCIYDFCFTKGRYAFTCAAIASYATNCQAVGVTIYPWRSATFCPPPCPLNSHYEHCAKACDQTCSSLHVPPQCPEKCEEDCVCNEGFVRSADTCVPMSECGCFYKGRYYPALEYFYPTCEERCRCEAGGNVVCHTAPCTPNEECKTVEGYRKCYPVGNATCSVVGDLYLSFDGGIINFQGTCTYFLTKLQKPNESLKPLAVIVKNEPWGNGKITLPTMVSVEVLGVQLTLLRNKWGVVLVDGVSQHLPVNLFSGHLRIFQHGVSITIVSTFGFALTYDQFSHVRLTIPSIYQDYVGGLCGNYNGDKSDDLQLPDGTVVTDVNKFAAAWKIPVVGVSCTDGCVAEGCAVCEEEKKEAFKQPSSCGLLTASNGPFSACHAIVKPEPYLDNCINDLCVGGGDQQILCHSLQSYMKACQEARVPIEPWRSATFCPLTCPANSYYTTCSNICETNCAGLTDHIRCPEYCVEGCQCDAGFFFDGLKCISLEECGCFERGRYFPPNEPVVFNDCKEKCICTAAGGFSCEAITCQGEETCEVMNGIMQCYGKGRISSNLYSQEYHCSLMPGAQLSTFDGLSGKVPAPGTFQLTSLCDIKSDYWFRVIVEVSSCPPNGVVTANLLYFFYKGLFITVNRQKEAWVNGLPVQIPSKITESIIFNLDGEVITLSSPQVQVKLNLAGGVQVTASPDLKGQVCGACGNFNNDQTDDLIGPNEVKVTDVPGLLTSWTARDFTPCVA
ncbi:IgGFc-binding protein-like [Zootoca vivipara]|uniref:IgGFc-binding protein-like n=1 Tax=Zootoca vivipara TaxID=8524 RepID=UPI00293BCE78|nr:IgGFc-binding protein-like [Zootoca vivipara]